MDPLSVADGRRLAAALRADYGEEATFVAALICWGRRRYPRRRAQVVAAAGLPDGANRAAVWRAAIDQLVAADG